MNLQKYTKEQIEISAKVITKDDFKKTDLIAGADQAFLGNKVISTIAVFNEKLEKVEDQTAMMEAKFPYISGFLYYREGPAIIDAFRNLKTKPNIMIIEGHGILHPLRIGMASQIGVVLDVPTIGIAKSLICGQVEEGGRIMFNNEIRGIEFKTREHSKPIYISPGHRISLETSMEIVKKCIIPPHKMPEPLYQAHRIAEKKKEELEQP